MGQFFFEFQLKMILVRKVFDFVSIHFVSSMYVCVKKSIQYIIALYKIEKIGKNFANIRGIDY